MEVRVLPVELEKKFLKFPLRVVDKAKSYVILLSSSRNASDEMRLIFDK
jgi:hypothetical protein